MVETEKTIGMFYGIIILIIFFILLFSFVRQIFLKGIVHFRLLKELYPSKLDKINSFLKMMWITNMFILDIDKMIWFWMPVYYTRIPEKDLKGKALEYHHRLIKINKKIGISFLLYILYLIVLAFLIYVL